MSDAPVKIYVDLPEHWAVGGESMWANPLGDDLYEIVNVPFHVYGINYGDVVRARAEAPDLKRQVIEVVERRGHHTLRMLFADEVGPEQQRAVLQRIEASGATYERANERHIAIDVPPETSYGTVVDLLYAFEEEGTLEYETCEFRVEGRFDLDSAGGEG